MVRWNVYILQMFFVDVQCKAGTSTQWDACQWKSLGKQERLQNLKDFARKAQKIHMKVKRPFLRA